METEPSPAAPEVSFEVEYQQFSGTYNSELRGKGSFTISATEPVYRFTGNTRATFSKATSVEFRSDQIWNVTVEDRKVQFETRLELSGRKNKLFVFFCSSPETAAAAADRLPQTRDGDFITRQDFSQKLQQLPAASSPWTSVTNLIIAANVAVFIVMGFLGAGWFDTASLKPYVLYVANNGGATTDGEWWRIVTSMFVHYGIIHLLLNMWALFQTGHFVEKLLGRSLFTIGYFGSGIVASFTSIGWHGDKTWSAGASGAVFGVFGLLLGFMLRERQSIPAAVLRPMMRSTLGFAGYNLLVGIAHPGIDNAAHLGGLAGGFAFGWLIALPIQPEARANLWRARVRLGAGAILAVIVLGGILSPRFDYRFREELDWADRNREPIAQEQEVLRKQQAAVNDFRKGQDALKFTRWLESESIPFYEKWRRELSTMVLTPGKTTAQRRQTMISLFDAKLANYRALVAAVQANDPHALERYAEAETRPLKPAQKEKK